MAGFFGLFDYSKAGPGVNKGKTNKKRFFYFWELFFRKFWKLVTLNLLYFACCIPIVTIGAATAGFTFVLRKLANEEPVFLASDFFEGFKKNWKQSTVVFLLDVILFLLLPFSISFYQAQVSSSWMFYIPMVLCMSALLIYFMMHYYIHLLIVTTNSKIKHILKNSFLLTCIGLKTNLITTFFIVAIVALTVIGVLFFIPLIILIPLVILSVIGFIVCYNSYQYIIKYVVEPYYRDMPIEEIPEQIKRTLHLDEDEEETDDEAVFRDMGRQEVPDQPAEVQTKVKKNKTIS